MKRKRPIHQKPTPTRHPESPQKPANSRKAALPDPIRNSFGGRLFAIDAHSLALFRILVGVLLLTDLVIRVFDLGAMYTDDGMFPRAEISRRATSIWNWSFHFGSGSAWYQATLFGLAGGLAVALILGFQTRLVTIGSWLMLVSLHHRVPPILSGAENLLRLLLFWAMFLPLGRVWSVDSRLAGRRESRSGFGAEPVASMASAAILLQMAMMYLFSAMFKSNPAWWRGEALSGILQHDFYASPVADILLPFPKLLAVLTWTTLILEWIAPLLLFAPKPGVRLTALAGLVVMHLGIGTSLQVGLFSYVCLAGLALFLPASFWNSRLLARFVQRSTSERQRPDLARLTTFQPSLRWFNYLTQSFCAVVLVYVLILNINSLPNRPLATLAPEQWRPMSRGLGLAQMWGMFSAAPSRDGWCIAKAHLNDGSEVDLLRPGSPILWSRPEFPAGIYPNHYWQKLFREMTYADEYGYQLMRVPVANFLCRRWNGQHPPEKQIAEFDLLFATTASSAAGPLGPQVAFESLLHLDFSDRSFN